MNIVLTAAATTGPLTSFFVVLTLTHRYNVVRGHRTGSNNSGAEDYLRRKHNKKHKKIQIRAA